MRTARLEIAIMISFNIACSAVPLFTLRLDSEDAAAIIFAFGGTIALVALLFGLAFTIALGSRRQKWASTACAALAVTPFFACIAVAQRIPRPETLSSHEDLGFGYSRRDGTIHFEGGGVTGWGETRIDRPARGTIRGFRGAGVWPVAPCSVVDAVTFVPLSVEYSRDRERVYYKWISPGRFLVIVLPGADVASFRAISLHYAVDANSIWFNGAPIPGSDPRTAELLAPQLIHDEKHVYNCAEVQPHLDASTIRSVGSAYCVDANGVYWGTERVEGADPESFCVLGGSFMGVDRSGVYRSGRPLPEIDAATCRLVIHSDYGYQVFTDRAGVYLNGLRFLHADPNDFVMLDKRIGMGGGRLFFVDTYHCTPVTLSRAGDRLLVETILFERETEKPLAIARGELIEGAMQAFELSPPPGESRAHEVPEWQLDLIRREGLMRQLETAAEQMDAAVGPQDGPGGAKGGS